MADHPTRQRLVRLIRQSRGSTLSDLRKQTGLSRSTLRQHLSAMTRQGIVEGRFVRRATGRPPLVYRLTAKGELAAPETYAAFLRAIVAGIHAEGRERIEGLFQQAADQLAAAHPEIRGIASVRDRMEAARRLFFGEVDSIETEPTETGYQFSIQTCPLAPLSMEFGDLCCVTRQALGRLVGREVEQSEWIIRGDPRCTFEVRTAAGSRARIV